MANTLLMPKATAVWLVDNTSLTFQQIADFCDLHELEVKGIADGDVAQGIKGMDPVSNGQLSRDEIERAQTDTAHRLQLSEAKVDIPEVKTKRGPKYTPLSRRQDRPDAISWLLRNHPELTDGQVTKLVGTTKPTIQAIRDRTHWNSSNIKPVDPVTIGLCKQSELDDAVLKAAQRVEREQRKLRKEAEAAGTLLPVEETIGEAEALTQTADEAVVEAVVEPSAEPQPFENTDPVPEAPATDDDLDADTVFAKLGELKSRMTAEEADDTDDEAAKEN